MATKSWNIIIVCGPTASGKSGFASMLAEHVHGVIINADSGQVYKGLTTLTASPQNQDKQKVQHLLYNFLELSEKFCVALYLQKAANSVQEVISRGKTPIVVGGSGLYISTLLHGINDIPQIDSVIFNTLQDEIVRYGTERMYEKLMNVDSTFACKISSRDSYRILRGYGIFVQYGKTFSSFCSGSRHNPLSVYRKKVIVLHPERNFLYENCNKRFDVMLNLGAAEEVRAVHGVKDSQLLQNAQRIIGFKELLSYLNGEVAYQDAVMLAKQNTRRYAKRQITWFANQISEKQTLRYQNFEELKNNISSDLKFLD